MFFPRIFFFQFFFSWLIPMFLSATPVGGVIVGKNIETMARVEVRPSTKGLVVLFLSAKCPCSMSHIEVIKGLAEEFKEFAFVGVHSNQDEALGKSQEYFRSVRLPFIVLEDEKAKIADQFQALKTPHVFVLNSQGKMLYKGGVTNSSVAQKAEKHYLREALTEIRAGRSVGTTEGQTLGCAIVRPGS